MRFLSLTWANMTDFLNLKHTPPGRTIIGLPDSFIRKATQKGTQKGGLNRRRRRKKKRFTRRRKR